MQTLRVQNAISCCFLVLIFSCKAYKNSVQAEEAYNVAKTSLNTITKKYLKVDAIRNYDTIVLNSEVYKYEKKDFKYTINKWQESNNLTIVHGYKNECADSIFDQFDFNLVRSNIDSVETWEISKLKNPKVSNKPKAEFRLDDTRIELSNPIFNEDYTKSLILVNYKGEGKIIFYLIKKNNQWNFVCELYDIFYHS